MNDVPLCVTTKMAVKMAAKIAAKTAAKQPVAGWADSKQTTKNKFMAEAVNEEPSFFRALVLIGVAAAFCATSVPHIMRSSEASKLAEIDHACPPQWLPVLLASAPDCGSAEEVWPCWTKCHRQGGTTAEILACKAANCPVVCSPPSPPPPSPPVTCEDNHPQFCQDEVSSPHERWTKCKQHRYETDCKLSCGYCPPAPPLPPPPSPPTSCGDTDPKFCRQNLPTSLEKSLNCKKAEFFDKCKASCAFCPNPPPPPSASPPLPSSHRA